MDNITLIVSDNNSIRIDKYLSIKLPNNSRSYYQSLIKEGHVKANGKPIKVSQKTEEGMEIVLNIPEAEEIEIKAENIPLDILYEDDDLLIVNKPKNMVVHPSAGHYSHTLVNAIMYHCKDSLSGINGHIRPGIVHRIDKDTTGSLIVCKNDFSHEYIAKQIAAHSVTRIYIGIVKGYVKNDTDTIDAPIGRHPINRKKMAINYKNGKEAVTTYRVLARFNNLSLVEFRLKTGRTHQIRVHMSSINHPLLGDELYSNPDKKYKNLVGQCLHALTIGFIHPRSKKYMEFSAPIPDYFSDILNKNNIKFNENSLSEGGLL